MKTLKPRDTKTLYPNINEKVEFNESLHQIKRYNSNVTMFDESKHLKN